MNARVRSLLESVRISRYPLCIEKLRIVLQSLEATAGRPMIERRAQVFADVLDRMPIFIEDGELIVGNGASKPMGLEIDPEYGIWTQDEVDSLKAEGYVISPEDERELQRLNAGPMPQTLVGAIGEVVSDDERLWPFMRSGVLLPPWKSAREGSGGGYAQSGLGLGPGFYLMAVDIPKVLNQGLNRVIEEAESELRTLRYTSAGSLDKARYVRSVLVVHRALIRFATRFADLAAVMAIEEPDVGRRRELDEIAAICRRVPAEPATTFREALQAFWFVFLVITPSPTAAAGRFDQYMHPFYERDTRAGRITDAQVLELLECLRIKDMQLNRTSGQANRKKNAGMAKWHNWTIGGVTAEGRDATNELTHLILDAARDTRLPHHTITLRVHDGTPDDLLVRALEVVKTGIGMPAFVGDRSYIEYFQEHGVSLEDAREYVLSGCLDGTLPGKSRTVAIGFFVVPLVLDIFFNDGVDPKTGERVGPPTGGIGRFESYEELLAAFLDHLRYFMGLAAEKDNIEMLVSRELFPDPFRSSLMADGIEAGRDVLDRTMPFENGAVLNPVGMVNVADSLAAIKQLVFDDEVISLDQLGEALAANWDGHDDIRKLCLEAPKYGNGDPYVDSIARHLYEFWAETTATFATAFHGTHKPTAISITSHQPGGALTGATPDGRCAGDICADGTMSPMQGMDLHGPTGALRSAMVIDQSPYQATLMNMKFHSSALQSEEDSLKLAALMRTYFARGGKHVQFNMVDRTTLLEAQRDPDRYRDLVVRVAGYSAFFTQLSRAMQDEVIARTEHSLASA